MRRHSRALVNADQKSCGLRADSTCSTRTSHPTLCTMPNMNWNIPITSEAKFVELVLNCKQEKRRYLLNKIDFSNRMDKDRRKPKIPRKEKFRKWTRSEVSTCTSLDLSYRHSHCPCETCNGRAVSSSTEFHHWERNNLLAK